MCKQLNGPVFKSLKPRCLGRNRKKNWPGRARAKILYFVSGRAGLRPKFQFRFGPGSGLNFNFPIRPGPKFFSLLRAGPRFQSCGLGWAWTKKSCPCRPLICHSQPIYFFFLFSSKVFKFLKKSLISIFFLISYRYILAIDKSDDPYVNLY